MFVSESLLCGQPSFAEGRPRQTFTVAVPKIRVVFELEDGNCRTPVLLFKSSAEASVNDWSKQMHMKGILCRLTLEIALVVNRYDKQVMNRYDKQVMNRYDKQVMNRYDKQFMNRYDKQVM